VETGFCVHIVSSSILKAELNNEHIAKQVSHWFCLLAHFYTNCKHLSSLKSDRGLKSTGRCH